MLIAIVWAPHKKSRSCCYCGEGIYTRSILRRAETQTSLLSPAAFRETGAKAEGGEGALRRPRKDPSKPAGPFPLPAAGGYFPPVVPAGDVEEPAAGGPQPGREGGREGSRPWHPRLRHLQVTLATGAAGGDAGFAPASQSHVPAVGAPRPHRRPRRPAGSGPRSFPFRSFPLPPCRPAADPPPRLAAVPPRREAARPAPRRAGAHPPRPARAALSGANGRAATAAAARGARRRTPATPPRAGRERPPGARPASPPPVRQPGAPAPPRLLARSAPGRRLLSSGARCCCCRRLAPRLAACAAGRYFRTGSGQRPAARLPPRSPVARRPLAGEPPRSRLSSRLARAGCHSAAQEVGSVTSLAAEDFEKRPFVL